MAASDLLVSVFAEAALAKYQKGIVCLDVDLIGAHWLSRDGLPVSGQHVHQLWRAILDRHGFGQHLYNHAIVVEVPQGDLQRLREHNHPRFCGRDPLLPPGYQGALDLWATVFKARDCVLGLRVSSKQLQL